MDMQFTKCKQIMKNHMHAIIIINNDVGAEFYSARNIGPIKNRPLLDIWPLAVYTYNV